MRTGIRSDLKGDADSCHLVIRDCKLLPMRTSVAALSCVAHLYWRTATITHSSAMPDKTAMRNTDDIRTPSLSIVLFLTPGEARIRILAEPCDYLSPRIGGVSGNDIDGILVGTQGSR